MSAYNYKKRCGLQCTCCSYVKPKHDPCCFDQCGHWGGGCGHCGGGCGHCGKNCGCDCKHEKKRKPSKTPPELLGVYDIFDYKYFSAQEQTCRDAVPEVRVFIRRPLETCNSGFVVEVVRISDNAVLIQQSGVWTRDAEGFWELQLAGTSTDRETSKGTGSIKIKKYDVGYCKRKTKLYWYFAEPAEGDIPNEGVSAMLVYRETLPQ